ncbi:hypothetical protein ABD87_23050 [Lysinibacillus sphaericus]|uniref:restriction endonuclease subunit S n=1 Tax=Lysinibacillus sphaericus TaxID=1421 RepID=UPI0018CCDC10|nr:hypothetical protein [Lysinibacillus sphaericus]MBG9732305.1 hypothetical protein [Lysinibacillus sphaericus]
MTTNYTKLKNPYDNPIFISSFEELSSYVDFNIQSAKNTSETNDDRCWSHDKQRCMENISEITKEDFLNNSPINNEDIQQAKEQAQSLLFNSKIRKLESYSMIVPLPSLEYQSFIEDAQSIYDDIKEAYNEIRLLQRHKQAGGYELRDITKDYLLKQPNSASIEKIIDEFYSKGFRTFSHNETFIFANIIYFIQQKRTLHDILRFAKTLYYRLYFDFNNNQVHLYGGQSQVEGINTKHVQPWAYDGIEILIKTCNIDEIDGNYIEHYLHSINSKTMKDVHERILLYSGFPSKQALANKDTLLSELQKRYKDDVSGKTLEEAYHHHVAYGFQILRSLQNVYFDLSAYVGVLLQFNGHISIQETIYKKPKKKRSNAPTRYENILVRQYNLKLNFNEENNNGNYFKDLNWDSIFNNDDPQFNDLLPQLPIPIQIVINGVGISDKDFLCKLCEYITEEDADFGDLEKVQQLILLTVEEKIASEVAPNLSYRDFLSNLYIQHSLHTKIKFSIEDFFDFFNIPLSEEDASFIEQQLSDNASGSLVTQGMNTTINQRKKKHRFSLNLNDLK